MKQVENTTGSDIFLSEVGVSLPPSDPYDIEVTDYLLWSRPDSITEITPYINSGDIVVRDSIGALSAARAIDYLSYPDDAFNVRFLSETERSNGFSSKTVQEAIEESRTAVAGKLEDFEYFAQGVTENKWLNIGHPSTGSDDVPLVSPWAGKLVAVSYCNKSDDTDTDLEIYVNGILQYTWDIRNKRTAWLAVAAGIVTIAQGDRISMYAKKVTSGTGTAPRDVSGEIYASLNTMPDGEGGTQNGV